jgi:penicillin-binding protein 1A
MGQKLPAPAASANVAANGGAKPPDIKPGPPPILTKRGAEILVQVEKMLDEAAKTAGDPVKRAKPVSSTSVAFPDSFAAATPDGAATSAPPKN